MVWHRAWLAALLVAVSAMFPNPCFADPTTDVMLLNQQAERLMGGGRIAEAFETARQALGLAEQELGPRHDVTALPLVTLGRLHVMAEQFAEAEAALLRVVDIMVPKGAATASSLFLVFDSLSQAQQMLGKMQDADQSSRRAVEAAVATFGDNHVETATLLSNRAHVQRALGQLTDAENGLRRAIAIYEGALGYEALTLAVPLETLGLVLQSARRFEDAIGALQRALAIRERAAPETVDDLARILTSLAGVRREAGQFTAARQAFERQAALLERHYGPDHPRTADGLSALVGFVMQMPGEALEPVARLAERALAIYTKSHGLQHAATLQAMAMLGVIRLMTTRPGEAEQIMRQVVEITTRMHGERSLEVAAVSSTLATLLAGQSRLAEAESLMRRALAIQMERLGADHIETTNTQFQLGQLKSMQGQYVEAETLLQSALRFQEVALGDATETATTLVELASVLFSQGRAAQAEPLLRRALAIRRQLGGDNLYSAIALGMQADVYGELGRHAEAERAARAAIAITDGLTTTGFVGIGMRATLVRVLRRQERYAEAEALMTANLAEMRRLLPADHSTIVHLENELAGLYELQHRYAESAALQQRVLAAYEATFGPESDATVRATNGLAWSRFQLGDHEGALALYEKASDGWVRRRQRELAAPGVSARKQDTSELARNQHTFVHHVRAAWRVMNAEPEGRPRRAELVRRSFELAQWANLTDAASALAQMAVRTASGNDERARLLRRYQDLSVQWQALDQKLLDSLRQAVSERNVTVEQQLRADISATDAALSSVRQQIEAGFPDYAALAFVKPLPTTDVRQLLRDDEALLQILTWGDDTFLWLATRQGTTWVRRNISWQQMQNRVTALRCGLDAALWQNVRSRLHCRAHLGHKLVPRRPAEDALPPFDLALAHDTYRELLGRFEDSIRGKHLIIVPTGPLTQLPFDVLVTSPPPDGMRPVEALRRAAWLGSRQPISVLPSVSSLQALRRQARPSTATKPLIGFANPLLDGPDAASAADARRARARQACPPRTEPRVAVVAAARGGGGMRLPAQRSGQVDLADLRRQLPLPDTVDELCEVAASLDAPQEDLHLGARATERQVKALNARGALASYKILHFATHGALTGEISGASEPGLVLTPPATATADDDGYLAASEIAELKLDADWVVLSACNTAAGGAKGAEALSGLARAFFYAGARALLVSHWSVYSSAAVELVTAAFGELKAAPAIGRAEAMRRARVKTIARGGWAAHPAYWSPFTVVGEGAGGG